MENFFQIMGVCLNGPKAAGKALSFNITFIDIKETYLMTVKNAVLNVFSGRQDPKANAKVNLTSQDFKFVMLGITKAVDLIAAGNLTLEGDAAALIDFVGLFDQFKRRFPIVTPRPRL